MRTRLRFAAICGQTVQKVLAPGFPCGMSTSKDMVFVFEWVVTKRTGSVPAIVLILQTCRGEDIVYELHQVRPSRLVLPESLTMCTPIDLVNHRLAPSIFVGDILRQRRCCCLKTQLLLKFFRDGAVWKNQMSF